MKNFQVTYDTVASYDVEASYWKRETISAATYEAATAKFHEHFPGNRIFSIDEVDANGKYVQD